MRVRNTQTIASKQDPSPSTAEHRQAVLNESFLELELRSVELGDDVVCRWSNLSGIRLNAIEEKRVIVNLRSLIEDSRRGRADRRLADRREQIHTIEFGSLHKQVCLLHVAAMMLVVVIIKRRS